MNWFSPAPTTSTTSAARIRSADPAAANPPQIPSSRYPAVSPAAGVKVPWAGGGGRDVGAQQAGHDPQVDFGAAGSASGEDQGSLSPAQGVGEALHGRLLRGGQRVRGEVEVGDPGAVTLDGGGHEVVGDRQDHGGPLGQGPMHSPHGRGPGVVGGDHEGGGAEGGGRSHLVHVPRA
ncbi:hypothetical protein ILP97_57855, partial [Amycolatopsis sp. H6(2020)]|nr:hypothetical protein [Amycolatopsis sp. H6(2020)]